MATKEITICDGLAVTIDTDILDDVELLERVDDLMNEDDTPAIVRFTKFILGDDQFKTVKKFYVDKGGRMRIDDLTAVVSAIFEQISPKA